MPLVLYSESVDFAFVDKHGEVGNVLRGVSSAGQLLPDGLVHLVLHCCQVDTVQRAVESIV